MKKSIIVIFVVSVLLLICFDNTTVDYVDYGTKEQPNLSFKDGFFYNIDDKNPFKQKQVTVVPAIAENIFDTS